MHVFMPFAKYYTVCPAQQFLFHALTFSGGTIGENSVILKCVSRQIKMNKCQICRGAEKGQIRVCGTEPAGGTLPTSFSSRDHKSVGQ